MQRPLTLLLFNLVIAIGTLLPTPLAYAEDGVTVRVLKPRPGIPPRLFHEERTKLDAEIEKAKQRRDKAKAESDALYSIRTGEGARFDQWFEKNGAGKPARAKRFAAGKELPDARSRMNRFDTDFRYEPEIGKQLEQKGKLRDEAWNAVQKYYDLYQKFLTFDAIYYETRVAQYDIYIGFEASDWLAEMGEDMAVIGWESISTTLGALFSECIDGAITKVIADYTVLIRISTTVSPAPSVRGPDGRFWDCALDSLKDGIAQMFITTTRLNFLHAVENLKIPRRVGEYWWEELITGEMTKKPSFNQAYQDVMNGFREAVTGTQGKLTGQQPGGLAAGVWVRSLKRLRGNYLNYVKSVPYKNGLLKNAVADMRARGIPLSNRAEFKKTLQVVHAKNKASYKQLIDATSEWDDVLARAEVYEVVVKTGSKLLEIYYNFSDFNWNNEMNRFYEVKRCLEHWSKHADPERIVEKLRAPAAEYTAFLRSCDPEKDAEYDRLLSEAEALLEQVDISTIPTGLMEEFIELARKIDEAVDFGSQNEENLRDAIAGFQRICQRDASEWQALQDTVNRFPGDVQAAADAAGRVKQAADQACSLQVYDQVQAASGQAGEQALRVAQINAALATAIQGLNLEQERVPAAEPGDVDQLLADLRSMQQSLLDLKGRIEEGVRIRDEQLALINEGLSKSGRFKSDRAKAASRKFSEFLKQVQAIAIPAPDQVPPYEQRLGEVIVRMDAAQKQLAEAIECTESLPDIRLILQQARQATSEMRTHMQVAATGRQRAETCVADWVARITRATMEDIRACRFEAAEAKFASLPPDAAIRNDLRWELQKVKTNDATANSVYDRVEEQYRAGNIDAAHGLLTALPQDLGCDKTQARRGPLQSMVVQAMNSKVRTDAAIKACRFADARTAIGGITGETELRRILERQVSDKEVTANEQKHKIQWLLGRGMSGDEPGPSAVRRIEEIAGKAECADVMQAAMAAIARLKGIGDGTLAQAHSAMDKCELESAWSLLDRVPQQNPGRKPAYGRFLKIEQVEKAALAALKAAGKLSGANKYSSALRTLDKALAQQPCPKTVQRLNRAKALVGRFGSTYAAIRSCHFKRAGQMLKKLPDGSARKRLYALYQRSQSAMQRLDSAEQALSQGRRSLARSTARKVLGRKVLCKEVQPRARRIIARTNPVSRPQQRPSPETRRPDPPPATGQGGNQESPECQRYAARMQSIGNIQKNLAARVQRGISAGEARSIQGQIIANTRKIHALIDESRAAGCHNSRLPEQYRRQFDRHFGR
jgi:hypothetical protein